LNMQRGDVFLYLRRLEKDEWLFPNTVHIEVFLCPVWSDLISFLGLNLRS
jgi:hypothetical protein